MTEEALFAHAVALPPAEREKFLDEACAGQPELRARLQRHLSADGTGQVPVAESPVGPDNLTPEFVSPAVDPQSTGAFHAQCSHPGITIAGRYKLLQQIGEGGMGTVWLAEQTQPVKRKVAVKLIRAERGTSHTILARFDAERQAIALMDHPHVAKLLDAGTTESGAPFFVMELVKGIPINEFCDQHRLSVAARLGLFQQVCSAVQHAHQKGIIHRDLKPSNILVESHDGQPVPKVIDFGLAKATTGLPLTDQTLFTGFGTVMGTPLYMAPEQATFNAKDVDTRSDIYALGVILYELLTGSTPLTRESIKKAALEEMLRLIRDQEAPPPSSRLSSLQAKPIIAAMRQTEPQKLARLLKGELDWIALKALAKDRERRYETANSFAKDIERFLNHEPVQAGPPSGWYRFRKFVQRNRPQVIAAGLVILSLLAGIAGTTWGLIRAEQRREAAEMAQAAEKREREYAQGILGFVRDDFLALTSVEGQERFGGREDESLGKDATLKQLLDRAAAKLDQRKDLDPRSEAELRLLIGINFRAQGQLDQAIRNLERCVALRREHLGPNHLHTLDAEHSLGFAYMRNGQLDLAIRHYEELLARQAAVVEPGHALRIGSMGNLANAYVRAGELKRGMDMIEQALAAFTHYVGPGEESQRLRLTTMLAGAYGKAGRYAEALALCPELLEKAPQVFGPNALKTLETRQVVAGIYRDAGRRAEAAAMLEGVCAGMANKLAPDDHELLECRLELAGVYTHLGRYPQAIAIYEKAVPTLEARRGGNSPDTLVAKSNLGVALADAGRLPEALALLKTLTEPVHAVFGAEHPTTLTQMSNLAKTYRLTGKPALAIDLSEKVRATRVKQFGNDHAETLKATHDLAITYLVVQRFSDALPLLEEATAGRRKLLGPEHPETLVSLSSLADVYEELGRVQEAIAVYEQVREVQMRTIGLNHPTTLVTLNNLAYTYGQLGRTQDAIQIFEQILAAEMKTLGATHPETLVTQNNLARQYQQIGKVDRALELATQAAAGTAKLRFRHRHAGNIMNSTIHMFETAGRYDEADAWRNQWLEFVKEDAGAESPAYAAGLASAGQSRLDRRQWSEAESVLREALAIRAKSQPEVWTTFNTMSMLGGALLGQKKYAEAEPLLLKGYEGMMAREKPIPPQVRFRISEALGRLVELYTALEKPDEVQKYTKLRTQYAEPMRP
jgi:serine/threonine protein kinase/tetratricopeptide (TPR) repeat protein